MVHNVKAFKVKVRLQYYFWFQTCLLSDHFSASKRLFIQCISQVYFSNLLALWSFQWVLPAKMYFSAAVVSWTKASICSCRLRHQLQIDFITHSNPQLGIANATLMRTRKPKQVYIVFCRGEPPTKWFQHRQLFAETFSCSIFASQQFSDFVDQMLPVGSR